MSATLLLADESPAIQRVIELMFADEDVRVVVVGDGDAAMARLEEQPPDIVLADVGMLGKNGYEVASYIKHEPHLSHIPVLLLTGAFEPVDERKANEAGCDGVISKPFEPQSLVGRVKELLKHSRSGATGRGPAASTPLAAPPPERSGLSTAINAGGDSAASGSLGDFFDKLDAAFANLPVARPEISVPEGDHADPDDIFGTETPSPPATALPSFIAPSNDVGDPSSPGPVVRSTTGSLSSVPPPAPEKQAMPPLAEAFAALLAAEQTGTAPANSFAWPRPAIVMDDLVERVAQRVLERLSDRVVRETTAEFVSSIAERVVREEIDRIKAAIRNL